jgi:hypothetical protein
MVRGTQKAGGDQNGARIRELTAETAYSLVDS